MNERTRATCRCPACVIGVLHDSDCAAHNGPALPPGPCDCAADETEVTE